jgi:hypothetical protein
MGRIRRKPLWPIALSLDSAADAMQCRRKTLADAIRIGTLRAYRDPTSKRIRITVRDLENYIAREWIPL